MFLPRALIIAAEPQLRATLVEQFAALGRYALRDGQLGAPGEDWPDAAIVDEAHCDPKALADARARGCRTRVVLIADGRNRRRWGSTPSLRVRSALRNWSRSSIPRLLGPLSAPIISRPANSGRLLARA